MMLDAQTLYAVSVAICALLGLTMLGTTRRPFDDGEPAWIASLFVGAVALLMIGLPSAKPSMLLRDLGIVALSVQYSLQYLALSRLLSRPASRAWLVAPIIGVFVLLSILGPEREAARTLAGGLVLGLQHIPLLACARVGRRDGSRAWNLLLVAIALDGAMIVVRALTPSIDTGATRTGLGPTDATALLMTMAYALQASYAMTLAFRERKEARRDANHRWFQSIFESTPDPIFIKDTQGRYLTINAAAAHFVNRAPHEIIGNDDRSLFPSATAAQILAVDRAIVSTGRVQTAEVEIPSERQDKRTVQVVKGPLLDPQGRISGIFGIARDISERKRTEETLRANHEALTTILDTTLDGFWRADLQGRILEANPTYCRLSGYSADEIRQMRIQDLEANESAEETAAHIRQVIETGYDLFESVHRRKDGSVWVVEVSASYSPQSGGQFFAFLRDITARKQAEQQLRNSEHRFLTAFRAAPIAASIARMEDGRFIEVNSTYEMAFGWTSAELIGRTSIEAGLWSDPGMRKPWAEQVRAKGQLIGYETIWRHRSGEFRDVSMSAVAIELDGEACILLFITDITDRKKMEEALREMNSQLEQRVLDRTCELEATLKRLSRYQQDLVRSEAKATLSTLVASVSHELASPIGNTVMAAGTIADMAGSIQKTVASGKLSKSELDRFIGTVSEGTGLMLKNLARADELIRDFRQVAADQASEQRRRFDLAGVVEEIVHTLTPSLKRQPHRLALEIPEGITMDSFPGPLGQVVINLINNAYLHAFEGRPAGTLRIGAEPAEDRVKLVIEDDGCGIPDANLGKLFEPFFSTKIGRGGTGLGMAIVKNLVEKPLGGCISVSSTVGHGTRFEVMLPLKAPVVDA